MCVCGKGGQLHGVKFMVWPVLSTAQQDIDMTSTQRLHLPPSLRESNHARATISKICSSESHTHGCFSFSGLRLSEILHYLFIHGLATMWNSIYLCLY